jgi:flagellar FliL protein
VAEETNNAEGEQEGGSSKKGLIIIIVAVLIAIATSVGVTLFLIGGDDGGAEEEAEVVEEVKAPALYLDMKPPILTTFNVDGRQRYMQILLSVSARDQAVLDAVEHHMPLIKARINSVFSRQDFAALQTEAGKQELREETTATINSVLTAEGEAEIESVYFSNFVLQ